MKVSTAGLAAAALLLVASATLESPEKPEPAEKPEPSEKPEQESPEQPQQPGQKDWQNYIPSFARKFVKQGQQQSSQKEAPPTQEQKKEADKETPTALVVEPLALAAGDAAQGGQAASSLSVAAAATEEEAAKTHAQTELERLKVTGVQELERQVVSWSSVDELAEASRNRNADAAEQALESRIRALDRFIEKPRKTVLDFNATQAVELVLRVNSASADVERMVQEQKQKMAAEFSKAKKAAMEKARSMEQQARLAARQWKAKGKDTIHAEKAARLGEDVWERHSDVLSDAAGDLSDRAEYFAERLEDKVSDDFSSLRAQLRSTRTNQRTEGLLSRAKLAVSRVGKIVDSLGATAAYKEAKSTAMFQAEEKKWEEASGTSPKATASLLAASSSALDSEAASSASLASLPVRSRPASSVAVVGAASIAAVFLVALRPRPLSQPDIEAPPLLG